MGIGVGLSICKLICESLDGDIQVFSILNQGSLFAFTMKVIEDSELLSRPDTEESKSAIADPNRLINAFKTHSSSESKSRDEKSQADSDPNSIEVIESRDQQDIIILKTCSFGQEVQLSER